MLVRCLYSSLVGGLPFMARVALLAWHFLCVPLVVSCPSSGGLPRRLGFSFMCTTLLPVVPVVGAAPLCLSGASMAQGAV